MSLMTTDRTFNIDNIDNDSTIENGRLVDNIDAETTTTAKNSSLNNKTDFDCIIGYAKEPLLPLAKACMPLVDIIYNLLGYVQFAINHTPEVPSDGLTVDESAAIFLYTMEWKKPNPSLYSLLNQAFKTGNLEQLRPYFKYLKLFLSALAKLPCAPSQTVWRGVTKDLSDHFSHSTVETWWSFSSCTTTMDILTSNTFLGNEGPRTLFSIEAINGRVIRNHSHYKRENEVLLLPGTRMIVQSKLNPAPDLHIIHLKQVVPKETLFEPPFKGNELFLVIRFNKKNILLIRCTSLSETAVSYCILFLSNYTVVFFIDHGIKRNNLSYQ